MAFLDLFRRRPRIRDVEALADFIDRYAAFLVQKGIYEYSRARAGPFAKMLLVEEDFKALADEARWRAYPLGLAMVGEVIEGILRPYGGERSEQQREALTAVVLSVFDRYPTPGPIGAEGWGKMRDDLARRLAQVGLHQPKRAMDIPAPLAQDYFNLMPIHEKLRALDFPTLHNYLKITLCNIHDEFSKRVDAPALAEALQ
jgi:hypothetical protein